MGVGGGWIISDIFCCCNIISSQRKHRTQDKIIRIATGYSPNSQVATNSSTQEPPAPTKLLLLSAVWVLSAIFKMQTTTPRPRLGLIPHSVTSELVVSHFKKQIEAFESLAFFCFKLLVLSQQQKNFSMYRFWNDTLAQVQKSVGQR